MSSCMIDKFARILETINTHLVKGCTFLVILFVIAMTFILGAQVVARYVFNSSIFWSEELARYLFIWVIFLCIAIGYRENQHISITTVIEALPRKGRQIFMVAIQVILIVFLFYLIK